MSKNKKELVMIIGKFTHIFINDKNMEKNRENKDEVLGGWLGINE